MPDSPFILRCQHQRLNVAPFPKTQPKVMGILNITPDSFSDGGKFTTVDTALERTEGMLLAGAHIIDIGGESSRPRGNTYGQGAVALSVSEELQRIVPIIEAIRINFPDTILSVDTYKASVAKEVLPMGVGMINDITGLRYNETLAAEVAKYDVPLVLMHSVGNPGEMPHTYHYDDISKTVYSFFEESIQTATMFGVKQLILDVGFGFGKVAIDNLRLLNTTSTFLALNRPILVGVSRKSTIGKILGTLENPTPVANRLFGTLGATAMAVFQGASLIRTHDVQATTEFLTLLYATANA